MRINSQTTLSGYKEFNEYLASPQRSEKAFNDAVSYMKQTTRKYAKGQVSWLRNKLLPVVHAANVESQETGLVTPTYLLDATGDFMMFLFAVFRADATHPLLQIRKIGI